MRRDATAASGTAKRGAIKTTWAAADTASARVPRADASARLALSCPAIGGQRGQLGQWDQWRRVTLEGVRESQPAVACWLCKPSEIWLLMLLGFGLGGGLGALEPPTVLLVLADQLAERCAQGASRRRGSVRGVGASPASPARGRISSERLAPRRAWERARPRGRALAVRGRGTERGD